MMKCIERTLICNIVIHINTAVYPSVSTSEEQLVDNSDFCRGILNMVTCVVVAQKRGVIILAAETFI